MKRLSCLQIRVITTVLGKRVHVGISWAAFLQSFSMYLSCAGVRVVLPFPPSWLFAPTTSPLLVVERVCQFGEITLHRATWFSVPKSAGWGLWGGSYRIRSELALERGRRQELDRETKASAVGDPCLSEQWHFGQVTEDGLGGNLKGWGRVQ